MSEFEWRLLFGTTGSDRDTAVGLHAGVGLAVMAGKHVGAFAEYRFTHFSAEHRVDDLRLDGDVSTHHLLVGIAFRL